MEKAIIASNISKKYKLYNGGKERLLDLLTPKSYGKDFFALTDVSFEADKGDVIGFVGINGSGKSTLSNIVAGIVPETSGKVQINGQAALIAVASGLKGDLTGRDNIELKLLMLGFNKEEIKELEPRIIEFSELENFIDQPVKSYSSGMKSRLGFAISVNVDPDILIIDEALSVGDKAFAGKSFDKMMEFKDKGKTMIFVSHSIGQMKKFCGKILWLEFGRVKEFGSVDEVIPHYEAFLAMWEKLSKKEREQYKNNILAGGTGSDFLNKPNKKESSDSSEQQEQLTSLLGHLKAGKSYIYSSPVDQESGKPSESFKHNVYYIKRQITYREETFYLLSESPSAEKDVIGWMKSTDLSIHQNVEIDEDPKSLYLNGEGSGFSRPWGGKNNIVYGDLKPYKNKEFPVNKTEKVGRNIWYRGKLNDKEMWINSKYVTQRENK
ncbi:hypothetical protein CIL05_01150 [Virgibacillus profundi]|uniref:ABC transporter domain-containing protein n=2 Tax=Virgibacillus profundi TaxID=2024555 RepID=A0A2A2IJI1_9BACI|nr:hypothetical protein CIL05_01150 [Virgibacillus profundi]PXY55868.1 teichoic acids export ABC transporter ATP-binding subunit TagH [Virgibacillus profundi]